MVSCCDNNLPRSGRRQEPHHTRLAQPLAQMKCTCTWLSLVTASLFLHPLSAWVSPRAVQGTTKVPAHNPRGVSLCATTLPTTNSGATAIGPRLAINENYPGLIRVHSDPDVFVIEKFLDPTACRDMIDRASEKSLERSPVAYAGWTDDLKGLVELAAKGPVAWLSLVCAWVQGKDKVDANQVSLVVHALQNYAALFVLATIAIAAFTFSRAEGLKELRTSTSTTLDDLSDPSSGTLQFVQEAAKLFCGEAEKQEARLFESPTVIRYEQGQVLAPHFDANRSAETEDTNRGGQTLATLIVYLNDVQQGGLTRFGKLADLSGSKENGETKLTVRPKLGDALLFFPADALGRFDGRTEHEGCPAVDEKWIARIWRHESRVPVPFGLSENSLQQL